MTRPTHKVEVAFGVGALGDTSSATTSGATDTGNAITCPDAANLRATTLLDIRMKVALSDWTPSATQIIASKDGGTNNRGWTLAVQPGGALLFSYADPSHTNSLAQSVGPTLPAFADGSAQWIRLRAEYRTGDFGTQGWTALFFYVYTSVNGNVWTTYGGAPNTGFAQNIGTSGATLNPCTGDLLLKAGAHAACTVTFYAFEMFTDLDTKSVARLDLDNRWAPADTSWTSQRGNVWTAGAAITLTSLWSDVTADWRGPAKVEPMGRASVLDTFNPGSATFVLENLQRQYDRSYAAGPHFGQLLPRVPVRWRTQYGAVVYQMFRGIVTGGWGQTYDPGNQDATVNITASDASVILTDAAIPDTALDAVMRQDAALNTLAAWWKLDSTNVFHDLSGNGMDLNVSGAPVQTDPLVFGSSAKATVMADNCTGTRWSSVVAGPTFTVEAWFQSTTAHDYSTSFPDFVNILQFSKSDHTFLFAMQITFAGLFCTAIGGYGIGPVAVLGGSGMKLLDGQPHHVCAVVIAGSIDIFVDGVEITSVGTTGLTMGTFTGNGFVGIGSPTGTVSATVDQVAVWSGKLDAATIARHNLAGRVGRGVETAHDRALFILEAANWPGQLVDLDPAATTLCQGYQGSDTKALDYLRNVEQTERGELFIDGPGFMRLRRAAANFNDTRSVTAQHTWAETDYVAAGFGIQSDDDRIVNESDVTRTGGATSTASDQTSIDLYGPRSFSVSDALNTTDGETQAAAGYYVWLGKDVGDRIDSLPVMPDDNPDVLWPLVLGAQIGDLQEIDRTPQGITPAITIDGHVEGVTYTFAPDFGSSTASYALSNQQARPGQVLIWGTWQWADGKVWGP